jgi:hypothetical protein
MAKDTIVRLTAWATIEGEISGDGESAAGKIVSLVPQNPAVGSRAVHFEASVRADASGRIRFDRVPEGAWQVQVVGMGSDLGKSVRVETRPGRVSRVVFGSGPGKEPVPLSEGN